MPKVRPLDPIVRKQQELSKWIKGSITEEKLADGIGITQQAVNKKVKSGSMNYKDLLVLFSSTNASDEEILRLMRV